MVPFHQGWGDTVADAPRLASLDRTIRSRLPPPYAADPCAQSSGFPGPARRRGERHDAERASRPWRSWLKFGQSQSSFTLRRSSSDAHHLRGGSVRLKPRAHALKQRTPKLPFRFWRLPPFMRATAHGPPRTLLRSASRVQAERRLTTKASSYKASRDHRRDLCRVARPGNPGRAAAGSAQTACEDKERRRQGFPNPSPSGLARGDRRRGRLRR